MTVFTLGNGIQGDYRILMKLFSKGLAVALITVVVGVLCMQCQSPAALFDLRTSLASIADNGSIAVEPSRADRADFPTLVRLKGGLREYGTVWGAMSRNSGVPLRAAPGDTMALQDSIRSMYARIDPGYLEFVEGIAFSYGVPANTVDMRWLERDFFMDARTLQLRWACTIVAVKTGNSVIVGRNSDMISSMYCWDRFQVESRLDGERSFVGNALLSPVNLVIDGVNDAGLFVGNMAVSYPDEYNRIGLRAYPDAPAVDPNHFMRILLARCATVAEAESLARDVPQWFSSGMHHLLLADSSGDMAVFEWNIAGEIHVIRGNGTWLACANALVGDGETIARADPKYAAVVDCLSKYAIPDMSALSAVMSGVRVPVADGDYAKTAWTALYDLNAGKAETLHDLDGWKESIRVFAK